MNSQICDRRDGSIDLLALSRLLDDFGAQVFDMFDVNAEFVGNMYRPYE